MAISRRTFLKGLVGGGFIAIAPRLAHATTTPKYKPRELDYELQSIPDDETELDSSKAFKARQVAEYILTTRDKRFLDYKDKHGYFDNILRYAQAVMLIDGIRYTVRVTSDNDRGRYQSLRPDKIEIYARPERSEGDKNLAYFEDKGLDGRVNSGNLPAEHRWNTTRKNIKLSWGQIDADNHKILQDLYESALDKIIAAYIKPK